MGKDGLSEGLLQEVSSYMETDKIRCSPYGIHKMKLSVKIIKNEIKCK